MEDIGKYCDVSSLGIVDLEGLIEKYPWYSHARQVLLYKLAQMGEEYFNQRFRDYAAFIHCRDIVYYKTKDIANTNANINSVNVIEGEREEMVIDFDNIESLEIEQAYRAPIEFEMESKPQMYILGGDYFTREDFDLLKQEERVEKVGSFVPKEGNEPVSYTNQEPIMSLEDFDSPEFFTETLAKIYTEQGYYEQAINVYAKLILLYPEKSTYFAALVDEIKSKN